MKKDISHQRSEETLEAKARWFQSLSIDERVEMLVHFTDLMLKANPEIMEQKDAQPTEGRILIVSKT